ncbi:VOC family protein [Roseomonas sp. OT10]|uniref:VOC family protein n=1 Tax=Roseomonas cutis TaxID=2897332 RepID=UPI001E3BD662|nr:VOC family protein [Roseomonas sp. OT10]UFN49943.1 VOC family protein [Roseomonas sp. OT10]
MPVLGWDHLHLRSADPDAAGAFYVEALGAEPVDRRVTGGTVRVALRLGGTLLFLETVPAETPLPPEPPFRGMEHIGLAVTGLDTLVERAVARGARVATPPNTVKPGIRVAFLEAPDRVRVELIERDG